MTDEADLRARHLDTIQSIIGRLSQNSFTVRGWSITLVSAVFALLATQDSGHDITIFALLPAWIFWGLDASYLRKERLFRALYDAATARLNDSGAPDVRPFDMSLRPYESGVHRWVTVLLSPSVAAIPVVLTLIIVTYSIVGR